MTALVWYHNTQPDMYEDGNWILDLLKLLMEV